MNRRVDIGLLAAERKGAPPRPWRRRRVVARYLAPGALIVGFTGLLAWTARDRLLPAQSVTVVPVVASRMERTTADAPLFQAAGWVEPRPSATVVSALAEGAIDRLAVVEGQDVKANEPVAFLIDREARLAVAEAKATFELHQAGVDAADAKWKAAQATATEPIQRQVDLAESEAKLARVEMELARLPFQIEAGRSRARLARVDLDGKQAAGGALGKVAIAKAQSEMEVAQAQVAELAAQTAALQSERAALARRRDAARRQLELRTDERRQLAEAAAAVQSAKAQVRLAQVALEAAQLRLERTIVRAPTAGRVLAVVARPGARVMGFNPGGAHDSSTVLTMYDPGKLQVRADVRLEDLRRLQVGQAVRIESSAVAAPLWGRVLLATSAADIQKNTLQVKVTLEAPPAAIKPDMLVQATFLSPNGGAAETKSTSSHRLLIPQALVDVESDPPTVWIADLAAGLARRRAVQLGAAGEDGLVEVAAGLAVGDRVIAGGREGLRPGQRIAVAGEDGALGSASANSAGSSRSPLPSHSRH